jgi:predicted transcriptional regulator YdeE
MQPEIKEATQIILMGMSFYGDPFDTHSGWDEENQIGRLWKRFMQYLQEHAELFHARGFPTCMYEVQIINAETLKNGQFEVFAGVEISAQEVASVPVDLSLKVLPHTQYAVFTFRGQEITSDWEKVLEGWLATSGYRNPYPYNFQYYDERFKGLDRLAESTLDVYLPISKA